MVFKLASITKKSLCVVECLKFYEERTRELRQQGSAEKPLFLSYVHPHNPVTSHRLAHWVKDLLVDSAVDESFSVNISRHG